MSGADFKLQCIEVAVKICEISQKELSVEEIFKVADRIEEYCNNFVGNK